MKNIIIKNLSMNLNIDGEVLKLFEGKKELKVYFYDSGCEGTKINLTPDFNNFGLDSFELDGIKIYYNPNDKENLEDGKIFIKTTPNDKKHDNNSFLFVSQKVKSRCSCSSSFSFENKLITSTKLKQLHKVFKNKP